MKESLKCKCGKVFKPIYRNGILFSKLCPGCLADKKRKSYSFKKKYPISYNSKPHINKSNSSSRNSKKHSQLQNTFQEEINQLVHAIDYGHGCIATGSTNGKMNAGHFYSVGGNNSIRFNLHNIWLQSEHSNQYNGGDEHRYREGILNIYGENYLQFMHDLKKTYPCIKLTKIEIEQKINLVRSLIKAHPQQMLENKERLIYRNKYNNAIGIYHESFEAT